MSERKKGGFLRTLAVFVIGGMLGTGFGVVATIFAYPFIFPPPPATETLSDSEQTRVVAKGEFIHANPSDPIHYGSGKVTVFEKTVFLNMNFKVGPGPAFHVYLVPKEKIRSSSDVKGTMYIDLGKLRSFEGSQKYVIPGGIDLKKYPSVVVWCEQFGVLISPADLEYES